MNKTPTTKTGKGAKGKAKGERGSNGGAAAAEPFVSLPPPRAEALSVAEPLNERGEVVCTGATTLTDGQLLELYRWLQLTRLVEERLVNLYRQTKVVGGVFR